MNKSTRENITSPIISVNTLNFVQNLNKNKKSSYILKPSDKTNFKNIEIELFIIIKKHLSSNSFLTLKFYKNEQLSIEYVFFIKNKKINNIDFLINLFYREEFDFLILIV